MDPSLVVFGVASLVTDACLLLLTGSIVAREWRRTQRRRTRRCTGPNS